MKLSMIFNALASGELHNLFLSEDANSIREDKKEVVLRAINLGLIDLYNRFNLFCKEITLQTEKALKEYRVPDEDVIEITHITYQERELVHHRDYRLKDVKTFVFMSYPLDKQDIIIRYKARHRLLDVQDIEQDTDIELPMVYLNALLYFIASRAYTSIVNQLDGDLNESNRYAQKYMSEVQLLERQGVDVDDFDEMCVFNKRGFV